MKKKLLAVAVAGAFAVPSIALADGSSVTISGFIKQSIEHINIGSPVNRANSSENRLADNGSRIDFSVKEDLGGGLAAIGLYDLRFSPQTGIVQSGGGEGNMWVGLESNQWGRVTIGRRDLHYYHTAAGPSGAISVESWSTALLSYVNIKGKSVGIGTGRRPNTVEYASPKWGMFEFGLAYSTDPSIGSGGTVGSMATTPTDTSQKAYAWDFAPQIRGGNWVVGYDHYYAQQDPATTTAVFSLNSSTGAITSKAGATSPDETADRIWGYYNFPQGIMVGFNYDRSSVTAAAGGADLAKRNAWSIPIRYTWGPNQVGYEHTVAENDSVLSGLGISGTGAKMDSIFYQYSLSKRTQVGVTYMQLNNDANAAYNLFVNGSGYFNTTDSATKPGEDPRVLSFTLNHSF